MKNRNGFTLVELLAVIAILAILVIIALPNVINMYNKAQKQTFLTEARNVYREAERRFLANSISGKNTKVFNSEDSTKLDMNGKKLQYCVVLNNSGKVSDMKVSNGKWVASLNGKAIDELTIDDLEDGNLDDYECVKTTDESCFSYNVVAEGEDNVTPVVTIEDATKCKNYLTSDSVGAPEDIATTLCNGDLYKTDNGGYTIQEIALYEISKDDYASSGLNLKYLMIEKVEVVDTAKCKNHLQSKFGMEEDKSTTLCTTSEGVNGTNLFQYVSNGYISFLSYDEAGLKVTTRALRTGIAITGYNIKCGTDVVIPSKIKGYDVIRIGDSAFQPCNIPQSSVMSDEYKVKFLNYKMNDEYNIQKVNIEGGCINGILTSVVLPNTLLYIGEYAFYYDALTEVTIPSSVGYIGRSAFADNNLTEVTIPSSVGYIGDSAFTYNDLTEVTISSSVGYIGNYAFAYNNIKTVTYNGNESNINFGDCPFYGNYNYPKHKDYCPPK